jgi:hypothetical protein
VKELSAACPKCRQSRFRILTFPAKSILRFLLPKLLYRQADRVKDTLQIHVEYSEVGSDEGFGSRIVGEPSTFTNARNGINIVKSPKGMDGLTEYLCLRIPICGIDLSALGNNIASRFVKSDAYFFCAFTILVRDEDFDAVRVNLRYSLVVENPPVLH